MVIIYGWEMVLAKSDGTTLQEHINDCLVVAKELKKNLPQIFNDFEFYDLLFITILFHDFGKIHPEFQKVLSKKQNVWEHQRHEIYSVIFTNKLVLNESDRNLMQKSIIAHHKSFEELKRKHQTQLELNEDFNVYWKFKGNKYHPKDVLKNLSKFPKKNLIDIINFITSTLENEKILFQTQTVNYSKQKHPVENLVMTHKPFEPNSKIFFQHLLFSGLLKMSDHYGSAKIKSIPILQADKINFWYDSYKPFKHQESSWHSEINTILIAPTGSGKTECALGWLKTSLTKNIGKIFYVLPYTASINAMHKRLAKSIENCEPINAELIGIQHGKIEQYLNQYIENDYEFLKEKSDSFKKMIHPFKITTPFQILKYFFGVKGFEIGFANLYGSKVIFDEIHAYDVNTFAQLVIVIKYLVKYFKCSIFIMTATLPTFQRKELESVAGIVSLIKPTEKFLKEKVRHKIKIYNGKVFDAIEELKDEIDKVHQVMIVLNTVSQAQKCYEEIKKNYPSENICLIHSRFTAKDRMRNEELAFNKDTKFLIGTQAIEVSLDIDYDLMITDPAPLDALLQRFGRVNRKGEKLPSPIYVCNESSGYDKKIYPKEIVQKTIQTLSKVDILSEFDVQNLIDEVYPDWLSNQKVEYEDTKLLFEKSLETLQPYSEHKEKEEDFYDKFDGVKVLPSELYSEYKSLIENGNFIEADGLMVGLHKSTYRGLRFKDDASYIEFDLFSIIKNDKVKTMSVILANCKYSSEIGLMTSKFYNKYDTEENFL